MAVNRAFEALGTSIEIGELTFCHVSLSSIGCDGGDPIDNTCLSNEVWVTKQPQILKDVPDITFTADYRPDDTEDIQNEVNVQQEITITFRNLGVLTFRGYLKSFTPSESGKGERWTGTGVIVVTNCDDEGEEEGPSYDGSATPA